MTIDERAPDGAVLVSALRIGQRFTDGDGKQCTARRWWKDRPGEVLISEHRSGRELVYAGCATVMPGWQPKGWAQP